MGRRADGYAPLAGKDELLEDLVKKHEEFEAQSEKVLMEVYDALYKVSHLTSPLRCLCLHTAGARSWHNLLTRTSPDILYMQMYYS